MIPTVNVLLCAVVCSVLVILAFRGGQNWARSEQSRLQAAVKASAADARKMLQQDAEGRLNLTDDARHRLRQIERRGK